jgi:midasin (ATPase involved in ribosome maturation)
MLPLQFIEGVARKRDGVGKNIKHINTVQMPVNINSNDLHRILAVTPDHHNIMLIGKHGIGKSQIIENYFVKHGKKVVTLFLGQMSDPGDLIGLPVLDEITRKTDFRPPWWFPENNEPVVLFLDELNRARPEILQCVMDLTLNKRLNGKSLPKGSRIITAVNDGEEYQLTDLDPALVSRFNIYNFVPTAAEWLLWAAEQRIDTRIIDFIEKNSDCLDSNAKEYAGLEKMNDRRSWQRVSEVLQNIENMDKTAEKTIAGIIGIAVASKFINFIKTNHGLNVKQILSDFEKYKFKLENLPVHELAVFNDGMFRLVETEDKQDVVKKYIQNIELYIKWLRSNTKNETLAHWTTLYDSPTYPQTKVAILTHSPYIFTNIINFIKDIKI